MVRFMDNHGMLSVGQHPTWRVRHWRQPHLHSRAHRAAERRRAHRRAIAGGAASADGVELTFDDRPAERVDDVVFACHGDQVLPLLADPTDTEREIFQHFTTTSERDVAAHGRELSAGDAVGARVMELPAWRVS